MHCTKQSAYSTNDVAYSNKMENEYNATDSYINKDIQTSQSITLNNYVQERFIY